MNTSEFLAWLCACDRDIAYSIWKRAYLRAHPHRSELADYKLNIYYTTDSQISGYWRSQVGKLNYWLLMFWLRVRKPQLRRQLYWLRWR